MTSFTSLGKSGSGSHLKRVTEPNNDIVVRGFGKRQWKQLVEQGWIDAHKRNVMVIEERPGTVPAFHMSSFEKVVKMLANQILHRPSQRVGRASGLTTIQVVFKALIVLHTMVQNGATDNVLQYLSSSDVLRLKNVSGGQWEGHNAPKNLQHYALYLDTRIRSYRDLKHDAIRVQSETNRDMRLSMSLEEDGRLARNQTFEDSTRKAQGSGGISRSKTIMGRKLRVMTFYLDDLDDELTITALRMLVKDLLVLFQAVNEEVINAELIVEYLGVAKKLQNHLNVSIPNPKHGLKNGRPNPKKAEKGECANTNYSDYLCFSTRSGVIYVNGARCGRVF
ncbi:hypothetical protein H4582DRAFT_2060917 [Lactarius indigo]|nr:hypothetical protein H4582DRAFT_2060917 [Lactarius indigo]